MQARQQAAVKAEHIIENQATTFMRKIRGLDAGSTISDLRAHTTQIQQSTLDNAMAMLESATILRAHIYQQVAAYAVNAIATCKRSG